MFKGYTITETLHTGSRSSLYRAKNDETKARVVIKSLSNPFPKPLEIGRLQHEYQLLQTIHVPGTPAAIGFEKSDNHYGIVLEDDGGTSLRHLINGNAPDLGQFLELAVKLCQILSGLHAKKYIHRDIKPSNIVFSQDTGKVQLIDFGMAVKLLAGTKESFGKDIVEGSLPYISPEQTGRMNVAIDYRSDLYSLGVTLFELITGRLPFNASHPLEWVHAHLAQAAPDPRTLMPDLPKAIALIIMKLLAKHPDDRYQSAFNLQKDLEKCLALWKANQSIEGFELSTNDTSGFFVLPSKLYGRDHELAQLTSSLREVIGGNSSQLVMVSGYSGIGKTVLVQEARKQIVIAKGNFIAGKFDQLKRGIPFSGFILAFTDLAQQILADREENLQQVKSELLDSLGDNAQIINQLFPIYKLILGERPAPASLLPEETSNRTLQTLKTFVKTMAKPESPLSIFLDDLQWADVASLTLLELLASDLELNSLCLIGSYRSNEVDASHPLMQSLVKIKEYLPFQDIRLGNLEMHDIQALLRDTFRRSEQETTGLAQLLFAKTEGNPFFLTQSLTNHYNDGRIFFDAVKGEWSWDLVQLAKLNISDNVVQLMASRIHKLSSEAQESLKLAACIGNEFSLGLLSTIAAPDVLMALKEALDQGLISSMDENYVLLSDIDQLQEYFYSNAKELLTGTDAKFKFLHDRVQQASYSLLEETERKKVHHLLGQNLNTSLNEAQRVEQICVICNQFNMALEFITGHDERLQLAEINLQAAKRAMEATAYHQALEYSSTGISLLHPKAVQEHYALWQGLLQINAQCNYLIGRPEIAKEQYAELLRHSASRMDKLVVYRALVDMYSSLTNHVMVMATLSDALALFGIKMPTAAAETKARIMASVVDIKWRLRKKTKEDLVYAPRCEDNDHIKLAEIIVEAGPSVFLASQDLFGWMVLLELRYALRLGNTPSTAQGFMGYGMIMNAAFGDLDLCFEMAEVGEAMNKEFGNPCPYYKIRFVRQNFIAHFKEDPHAILEEFYPLAKMAQAAGDYIYMGLTYQNILTFRACLGHSLKDIVEQSSLHLKQLQMLNNNYGRDLLLAKFQSILALRAEPLLPWSVKSNHTSYDKIIEELKESKSLTNLMVVHISMLQTFYLLDQHKDNIFSKIRAAGNYKAFIDNTFYFFDFALYQSLAVFKIYKDESAAHQKVLQKIMAQHIATLKRFFANGGHIYQYPLLLLTGLQHLTKGRFDQAMEVLDTLLAKAEQENMVHIMALANELIGQQYLELKRDKLANIYLKESAYCYERWGATEKVKLMIKQYPGAGLHRDYGAKQVQFANDSESFTSEGNQLLDIASLMKSATTISEEIVLNKLLPSMISIVVENAGAKVGYLVLEVDNKLVMKVKRHANDAQAELMHDMPVLESTEVAQTVIQYTFRTNEMVILDHAHNDTRFKNDPYIQKHKSKSILCFPILHKEVFIGVFYLENNMVTHAFSEERVNVMKILSSQIAISLDNALLYQNLTNALDKQLELTEAYSRFTPQEYLRFLGHTSILEVKLGDYRNETLTVLFSDIRSYTRIAEQFTAEENFKFLSDYLETMTEIITRHSGMVNQLLGDGILAFFNHPKDALRAAVKMQQTLQEYKVLHKGKEPITIRAGIGLHSGEVIIGIMGNAKNMDTGIVSDTVNIAARIEGLTKYFGANILLSEDVARQLEGDVQVPLRYMARVQMLGKNADLGIYECFEGDPDELKSWKLKSLEAYHSALDLYSNKQFMQASTKFGELRHGNGSDTVLKHYHDKATSMIDKSVPDDWTATLVMEIK